MGTSVIEVAHAPSLGVLTQRNAQELAILDRWMTWVGMGRASETFPTGLRCLRWAAEFQVGRGTLAGSLRIPTNWGACLVLDHLRAGEEQDHRMKDDRSCCLPSVAPVVGVAQ